MKFLNAIKTSLFGVSDKEATFQVRGFQCPDPNLQVHLETIGFQFLHGYHKALVSASNEQLAQELDAVDTNYRGFSYEGAAMALVLLDRLNPFHSNSFHSFAEQAADHHIYMLHVGAGWALARLPFNLDKALVDFHPVYRWLVVDGYGFHQAYFKTKKHVYEARIPSKLGTYTKHAYCQGIGRALWFVCGGQPDKVAEQIRLFPRPYHGDLWAGIGLACTYAGGVGQEVIHAVRELGQSHQLHLAQGAVFGAKARLRAGNTVSHTRLALTILAGVDMNQASAIADESLVNVESVDGSPAYEIWRKNIRQRLEAAFFNSNQKIVSDESISL